VTALVPQNETFSFDWAQVDQSLVDIDSAPNNNIFVINSAVLVAGNYSLQLKVISSTGLSTVVTQNLSLSLLTPQQESAEPVVAKNLDLGGCSISGNGGRFDPLLLLFVLISVLYLNRRRLF